MRSIAGRLTAWYIATAFSLVLVATGLLYWTLLQNMRDDDQRMLADKVHVVEPRPSSETPSHRVARSPDAASLMLPGNIRALGRS